jgi:NAD(P)-dependent dehydrogenase (short-subunit alcohol dehydrogenase family)
MDGRAGSPGPRHLHGGPASADRTCRTKLGFFSGHETFSLATLNAPFWDQPLEHWESMFDYGVRNHVVACHVAAPLFVRQQRGLIVTTTFWDRVRYLKGNLFYDLAKAAMNRLAFAVAEELRPYGVISLAVAPGWCAPSSDTGRA